MDMSVRSMIRAPPGNPKRKACLLSRLFFLWLIDIVRDGNNYEFEDRDIPEALPDYKSGLLSAGLQQSWENEKERAKRTNSSPSFLKAILNQFGSEFLRMSSLYFIREIVTVVVCPYLLQQLLEFFTSDNPVSLSQALLTGLGLCVITLALGLANVHFAIFTQQLAVKVRAACISMVYSKCLCLSQSGLCGTSAGQVINLVSNDVARFELVTFLGLPLLCSPVVVIILMIIIYQSIGTPCVTGFGAIAVIFIIQFCNAKLTTYYRVKTAKCTDQRILLMDEIVLGMQVIKLYAWEKPFQSFINSLRHKELNVLRKVLFCRATYMFFLTFAPRMSLFCILATYVLCGIQVDAKYVFVLMMYLHHLAGIVTSTVLRGYAEIAECMVSIRRIQEFLLRKEYKQSEHVALVGGAVTKVPVAVQLTGVSASWVEEGELTLSDLNMDIHTGQLLAVIGTVGAGKSSLLNLLLGELQKQEGKMQVNGVVSYASQEPWIFSSSVRQNILFREDYNPSRYKAVCKACELERDFDLLPRRDKTLVGEKGASLSGGQRARISLARAIYKKADIYLLDDPLSAVDPHVGKYLFYQCIQEFLKDKTRILVTHQVQHLSKVDQVILMENGRILIQGTHKELLRSSFNFASVLSSADQEKGQAKLLTVESFLQRNVHERRSTRSEKSVSIVGEEIIEYEEFENDREPEHTVHFPPAQLYRQYVKAGVSPFFCGVVVALMASSQVLISGFDYWTAHWLHKEQDRSVNPIDSSLWSSSTYIVSLGSLLLIFFIVGNLRGIAFFQGCIQCSHGIHNEMVQGVIGTTLSFFHNNSAGRILNRFARDLCAIDEWIVRSTFDVTQALGMVLGSLVLAVMVNPWLLVPVAVLTTLLCVVRHVCLAASKNLKRVEGILRSPVYAHITASLQGLATIRAHSAEKLLQLELSRYQDLHTSVTHLYYNVLGLFSLGQECIATFYIAVCIFSLILLKEDLTGTKAALVITQSLTITSYLQWGMKMSAEVSNQMTSFERAIEYTHLEPEETPKEEKMKPITSWPRLGLIEFRNVFLRYEITEPFILRNLTLTVLPMEKVGIVGRTGAGKSSLIAALFRLAPIEGSVFIDAVDTSSISLESLRSRISIIPQDPVLFLGSLRTNLDPFQKHSDNELYNALEQVKLNDLCKQSETLNLDMQVAAGGANFSVGQRQLICLARAILRNNKILVLDEATANVDPQTDGLIQSTIRLNFAHCTVLTVAHRLNTIIDSDRVLVMDAGTVVEFDHPHLLIGQDGLFSQLVAETGPSSAAELALVAHQNYKNRDQLL